MEKINQYWGANKKFIITNEKQLHETKLLNLNSSKAKKQINWHSKLSVSDTIKFTVNWYKSFLNHENMVQVTDTQISKFNEMK